MLPYDQGYPPRTPSQPASTVLIVHSDLAVVRRRAAAVRRAGFLPLEATGFQEAKQLFDSERPQAMIVDIRLGDFNGLQLLISTRMDGCEIPVAITSDTPDVVLGRDAKQFGAMFLAAPVALKTFLRSIPAPTWVSRDSHALDFLLPRLNFARANRAAAQ